MRGSATELYLRLAFTRQRHVDAGTDHVDECIAILRADRAEVVADTIERAKGRHAPRALCPHFGLEAGLDPRETVSSLEGRNPGTTTRTRRV